MSRCTTWTHLRSRRVVTLLASGPGPRGTPKQRASLRASNPRQKRNYSLTSGNKICCANFATGLGLEPR